ncbi:hypothetical protein CYMTET_33070, partial [Cymbomonas tetramitiformis]
VLVPPGTLMELYTMNKIVPPLAPLPTCHTLEVEDPGDLGTSAFGALADVPLEFQLEYKRVSKVHAKIRRTRIMPSMESADEEPWVLGSSVWKRRNTDSDSEAFFDTPQVVKAVRTRDFSRLFKKSVFTRFMVEQQNELSRNLYPDEDMFFGSLQEVLSNSYLHIHHIFMIYAARDKEHPFNLNWEGFKVVCTDCGVLDEGTAVDAESLENVFRLTNIEEFDEEIDEKMREQQDKLNDDDKFTLSEFIEALCRVAIELYAKSMHSKRICDAIRKFLEEDFYQLHNKVPDYFEDRNVFRQKRMYNSEVDGILRQNFSLLQALFDLYKLHNHPPKSRTRPKYLQIAGWMQLLTDVDMIDSKVTPEIARTVFKSSQMLVINESDIPRTNGLMMPDFLEAISLLADILYFPAFEELAKLKYVNFFSWYQECLENPLIPPHHLAWKTKKRPAVEKNRRPLVQQLDGFLEILFQSIWFRYEHKTGVYTNAALEDVIKARIDVIEKQIRKNQQSSVTTRIAG